MQMAARSLLVRACAVRACGKESGNAAASKLSLEPLFVPFEGEEEEDDRQATINSSLF